MRTLLSYQAKCDKHNLLLTGDGEKSVIFPSDRGTRRDEDICVQFIHFHHGSVLRLTGANVHQQTAILSATKLTHNAGKRRNPIQIQRNTVV